MDYMGIFKEYLFKQIPYYITFFITLLDTRIQANMVVFITSDKCQGSSIQSLTFLVICNYTKSSLRIEKLANKGAKKAPHPRSDVEVTCVGLKTPPLPHTGGGVSILYGSP